MKRIATKLWVYLFCPIWSFFINLGYVIFNLSKYNYVKEQKIILLSNSLEDCMSKFKWKEDNLKDWYKWVSVLIIHNFIGDCDDAARLSKFWFKQNGVESEILNLYSDKEGHTVCVTKNRETMVTNERVVNLNPTCWEKEMLEYFGNKYTIVI